MGNCPGFGMNRSARERSGQNRSKWTYFPGYNRSVYIMHWFVALLQCVWKTLFLISLDKLHTWIFLVGLVRNRVASVLSSV